MKLYDVRFRNPYDRQDQPKRKWMVLAASSDDARRITRFAYRNAEQIVVNPRYKVREK